MGVGSAADGVVNMPIRRVRITDCGRVAFKQLLLWLYSGVLDYGLSTEVLASVLRLADLYRIPSLGAECERLLMPHVDVESVLALLQVSTVAHAPDLEACCLKFVVEQSAAIRQHPSYDDCANAEVVRRV